MDFGASHEQPCMECSSWNGRSELTWGVKGRAQQFLFLAVSKGGLVEIQVEEPVEILPGRHDDETSRLWCRFVTSPPGSSLVLDRCPQKGSSVGL